MTESIAGLAVILSVFMIAASLVFSSKAVASVQGGGRAIVVAIFGTTYAQTKDPWAEFKKIVAEKYPGVPVYFGYTSSHVAKTLKGRGEEALTLAEALVRASADGHREAVVQSLHVVPGEEYEMVRRLTDSFTGLPKGIERSAVGSPLIGGAADATELAGILYANLPGDRKPDEAVVFVGHGSPGAGGLAYPALQAELWRLDKNLHVGVVEFGPDAKATSKTLLAKGVKTVWLIPLLAVVGDHGQNDLFSDNGDSWKNAFAKAGIACKPVTLGLAFQPGVAAMWAAHLDAAFESLNTTKHPAGN